METQINKVAQFLRRAALRQENAALTDGQLLARFIEQRDQAAITALVQRHGPMVCLRPDGCRRGNPVGDDATRQGMNVGHCW